MSIRVKEDQNTLAEKKTFTAQYANLIELKTRQNVI